MHQECCGMTIEILVPLLAESYKSWLAPDKFARSPIKTNSGITPNIYCRTAPHADWLSTFIAVEKRPVKRNTLSTLVNIRDVLR